MRRADNLITFMCYCFEIREPQPAGTLMACPGLYSTGIALPLRISTEHNPSEVRPSTAQEIHLILWRPIFIYRAHSSQSPIRGLNDITSLQVFQS